MAAHLDMRYVRGGVVERRDYQVSLAGEAMRQNSMVVLPTGLGKTAIALQVIAGYLDKGGGSLFLAPTRVLASQHYEFLREALTIDDISLVTGGDSLQRRKKLWNNSVVCATPEIARNDLERGMVCDGQFGLVIFDEAHRAVGDYAYTGIAARMRGARILGMTATLPSEQAKAEEVLGCLGITAVRERTEASPDVRPYIHDTSTEWHTVELPPELKEVQGLLKRALAERHDTLRRNGVRVDRSLSSLLRARPYVLSRERRSAKPLFAAIRIHYALSILEAHGITPFLKFCERAGKRGGIGAKELLESDGNFVRAISVARGAQARGIEHSKIPELVKVLSSERGKALVFTSYRDSVDLIREKLEGAGVKCGVLVGKAGEGGLAQKRQVETVRQFKDGQFRVLIATRVGEEGLDIAEVNLVIFYDNVPSSIRFVQRRGRTGRKDAGRLAVLVAKGTIDETYRYIGQRKVASARTMGSKVARVLEQNSEQTGLDAFLS